MSFINYRSKRKVQIDFRLNRYKGICTVRKPVSKRSTCISTCSLTSNGYRTRISPRQRTLTRICKLASLPFLGTRVSTHINPVVFQKIVNYVDGIQLHDFLYEIECKTLTMTKWAMYHHVNAQFVA